MAVGGRSQVKMLDETFDFVCTSCARGNKTVEAVKYCLECAEYCCQTRADIHKKIRSLIGHNLTDVSQQTQATSQQSILTGCPTERNSVQKGKVTDMYCEYHNVVSCVCSKMAQEKMKVADCEKNDQLQHDTGTQVSFVPNQSLIEMEYTKKIQGIGQVQKRDHLYKIKESKDINIKMFDDRILCDSLGSCLTNNNRLLVTDCINMKLKCVDLQNMSVVDYCTLDARPFGVCCISKHEVVVTCRDGNKIQFVSIDNKMTPTRQIKMSHFCYGVAFKDGKLYATDSNKSLYVYDMTGTLLKTITCDNAGNNLFNNSRYLAFNESGSRLFVGGGYNGLVCFDGIGNYLSTVTDTKLDYVNGICVDGRGNVFVGGYWAHNVIQYSEDGKKHGVVVKREDGLLRPPSMCFHQGLNALFVTMSNSDIVKMYELK